MYLLEPGRFANNKTNLSIIRPTWDSKTQKRQKKRTVCVK